MSTICVFPYHTDRQTDIHTHTHTHTHTHMQVRTHTHIHTHIPMHVNYWQQRTKQSKLIRRHIYLFHRTWIFWQHKHVPWYTHTHTHSVNFHHHSQPFKWKAVLQPRMYISLNTGNNTSLWNGHRHISLCSIYLWPYVLHHTKKWKLWLCCRQFHQCYTLIS